MSLESISGKRSFVHCNIRDFDEKLYYTNLENLLQASIDYLKFDEKNYKKIGDLWEVSEHYYSNVVVGTINAAYKKGTYVEKMLLFSVDDWKEFVIFKYEGLK